MQSVFAQLDFWSLWAVGAVLHWRRLQERAAQALPPNLMWTGLEKWVVEGIVAKLSKRQPAAFREMQESGWEGRPLWPHNYPWESHRKSELCGVGAFGRRFLSIDCGKCCCTGCPAQLLVSLAWNPSCWFILFGDVGMCPLKLFQILWFRWKNVIKDHFMALLCWRIRMGFFLHRGSPGWNCPGFAWIGAEHCSTICSWCVGLVVGLDGLSSLFQLYWLYVLGSLWFSHCVECETCADLYTHGPPWHLCFRSTAVVLQLLKQ